MHMSLGFAYNLEVWHIFPKLLVMEIQTMVHYPALPLQVSLHQNKSFKRLINFVKIMIYDERHSNTPIKKSKATRDCKTQPTTRIMWEFNCSLLGSYIICGFTCAIHFPSTLWVNAILDFFQQEVSEPHLMVITGIFVRSVKEAVNESVNTHTPFLPAGKQTIFVQSQNRARCTCLLQNLSILWPKEKHIAEAEQRWLYCDRPSLLN